MLETSNKIPENESWLREDDNIERIEKSLEWAKNTPRNTDNFEEIVQNMDNFIHDKFDVVK